MKKLLPVFILLSALFIVDNSFAQGLPKIDSIKVKTSNLPGNPLFITAIIRTPSSHAIKLNSSFLIRNDTVFLSGCYVSGPLQTPGMTRDTFRIGTLNPGIYTIHYRAFLSGNFNFCDSSSSHVKIQAFSIGTALGIQQPECSGPPTFFPNPVKDVLWVQGSEIRNISVKNLLGEKIKTAIFSSETKTKVELTELPKGIYLLEILEANGAFSRQKFLKL